MITARADGIESMFRNEKPQVLPCVIDEVMNPDNMGLDDRWTIPLPDEGVIYLMRRNDNARNHERNQTPCPLSA